MGLFLAPNMTFSCFLSIFAAAGPACRDLDWTAVDLSGHHCKTAKKPRRLTAGIDGTGNDRKAKTLNVCC
jgi:hypothetical protein